MLAHTMRLIITPSNVLRLKCTEAADSTNTMQCNSPMALRGSNPHATECASSARAYRLQACMFVLLNTQQLQQRGDAALSISLQPLAQQLLCALTHRLLPVCEALAEQQRPLLCPALSRPSV